eukprot:354314-Chlamydomonas_euryale.AAC.8
MTTSSDASSAPKPQYRPLWDFNAKYQSAQRCRSQFLFDIRELGSFFSHAASGLIARMQRPAQWQDT